MPPSLRRTNEIARLFARTGVTMQQASEAMLEFGKAAAKVPFIVERSVLLRAWRREYGISRFVYPRWWRVFLFG